MRPLWGAQSTDGRAVDGTIVFWFLSAMNRDNPFVVIVVLNWNRREDSAECLESLRALAYPDYKVLLVDNGSTDGSVGFLRERFDEVTVIENERNLGFAEGNNVGIRRALEMNAEFVLLLNNDTTVEADLLTKLVAAARADETIGIIGPQINNYYRRDRISFAGGRLTMLWGWSWHIGNHTKDRGQFTGLIDQDYQTGAAMMLSRKLLTDVGMFDADYVSYCEDSDLSLRARAAGYRVVCCRDALVYHKISRSTGGGLTPHKAYRKILSGARLYRRHAHPFRYYTTIAAFNLAYAAASAMWMMLLGRFRVAGAICRGFWDLWRGRDRDRSVPSPFKGEG